MSEHERWNTRFSGTAYLFGTEPNAFLKTHAGLLRPGQNVLAVADGEGRNGVFLATRGLNVESADFSELAQGKAKKLAAAKGVRMRFTHADILNWDWPMARYDAVIAIFVQFVPPAQRPRFFTGIKATTKPGGLVLMQGYRPEQLSYRTGGPPKAEQLYTRALLEEAFGDWEILELNEHDSEITEGKAHVGMSALINLVARKPPVG